MFKVKQSLNQYRGLPKEIYVLFIGRIINCLGSFVSPLLALILTQKFGMSSSESGSFIAMQSVLQGAALMLGGKIVDSFGRKKVMVIFQSLGAVLLILCGIMPISMFTAKMMMISSCLYSVAFTAYDALQADVTNIKNRKVSYSLLYMGINIGFSIGPIIGGFLYANYITFVFIGDGVTTLISMALVVMLIKEKKIGSDFVEGNGEEVIAQEINELEESVEGSIFSVLLERPTLVVFGMIMFFIDFTYAQWPFALPLQMGKLFGSDGAKIYGLLGAANGIVVIVATPFIMRLTRKFSELINVWIGAFIYVVSFLMFGFVSSIQLFFIGVIFMTFGEIILATNSSAFVSNNSPASHRGRVNSAYSIMTGSGTAISPMIIGRIMDNYGMMQGYILTAGSSAVALILVAVAIKMVKKSRYASNSANA